MVFWRSSILALGILPYGFLLSLTVFYVHTAYRLGQFLSYQHADPESLPDFTIYHNVISVMALVWLFSFFAWTVVAGLYVYPEGKNTVCWRTIALSTVGHALALLLFCLEINAWYLD